MAGCIAPAEEADELIVAAEGDEARLEELVTRREHGEPLAWVVESTVFLGQRIVVHRGVYVPRPQSELLARRGIDLLPPEGAAADLCTGSGAIAAVLSRHRPRARVVASDIDSLAYRCAAANGVEVYLGNLADPLPAELRGTLDVVVAVTPYVPSEAVPFLPRDARDYEPLSALDGGPGGLRVLQEAIAAATSLLHPGGTLLLELGGVQDAALDGGLSDGGFGPPVRIEDDDGVLRGIEASLT
jgi:release factor glutamine methyltransferase